MLPRIEARSAMRREATERYLMMRASARWSAGTSRSESYAAPSQAFSFSSKGILTVWGTAVLRRRAEYQFQMPVVNFASGRDEKPMLPKAMLSRAVEVPSHLHTASSVFRVLLLA